jgi:hypothetical protein
VFVTKSGGLSYNERTKYLLNLTANANGTTITCSLHVTVADVNNKPVIFAGGTRNVSEVNKET